MEITAVVPRPFVPVTIKINTPAELANLIGALIGYGTANKYAESNLKAIGLGEFYSGNVRRAAREIASDLAVSTGVDVDALEAVLSNYKPERGAKASLAGEKVRGTDEDFAPGYEATTFEQ